MEKTTSHYPHPTGFAFGLTAGVAYIICAIFFVFWPSQALRFFNDWFHGLDLSALVVVKSVTLWTFVKGLVEIVLFFYIMGFIFALIYNKCVDHCKKKRWL
ncbi:hypothetical protein J4457_05150 [Candidatus Woesearchaeota archaeon]|nr:hypothetical protein [Candidatus Woesearchaeota archaeon]